MWYGLTLGCGEAFCGIASYSSADLQAWHYNGLLFEVNTPEIKTLCFGELSGNCGRPHIIYSASSNEYILWVNAKAPGYAIFTSSSPIGGFVESPDRALVGYQPAGPFMAGDLTVQVINGTGYIVYSLLDFTTLGASIWPPFNQSLYVQELTPDMRNTTGTAHQVLYNSDLVDYQAESPDIFKRGDYFYITASNTCGYCTWTLLIVYRSKSLAGPWQRQILSGDTCGGQTGGVLTLPSPSDDQAAYLHIADMMRIAPLAGTQKAAHGHQLQILHFNTDGSLENLNCSLSKSVTVSIIPGNSVPAATTGRAISATDGSGEAASYTGSCDLPAYQLYQTWKSSKSGTLDEVGINIAGQAPTGNLSLTIFRYDNDTNFFTPFYVWETLATFELAPSNVTQGFKVVRVPVGKTVAKGDHLGIALLSNSITPFCTLNKEASSRNTITESVREVKGNENGHTLFAIGANHVSLRGEDGTTPPIQTFDHEIKWYATVM